VAAEQGQHKLKPSRSAT